MLTKKILKYFTIDEDTVRDIYNAALLHDIAMAGIQDYGEFQKIGNENAFAFTQLTIEFINSFKIFDSEIPIILHLHEKFDGTGFPYKLKGESIPLGSRIIAVADLFETLVNPQFDEAPDHSVDEAIIRINRVSGTTFDPEVVSCFNKFGPRLKDGTC